jgi:GNAT superfamily N-acetyltransferase
MSVPVAQRSAHLAVEWAAAEGWNPGVDDAERFLAADPDAFLATERDGEIAGTVSCALYGNEYAFLGFFIVHADQRSRGIGGPLFERALDRAEARVVGLDAVPAQVRTYARRGFVAAHRNVRWGGEGGGASPAGLVELGSLPFADVGAFDAEVFGTPREAFLRAWVDRPPGTALACVRDGTLAAYGVLRPCRVGAKIGPLFAHDAAAAEAVLEGLMAAAGPGTEVFLDVPEVNPQASALARDRGMKPVFETARMYRNGRPPEGLQRVFGITTFEFG